jgi:hypothetical protein
MTIRERYSHKIADDHKKKKREEAETRQQVRKQLSNEQQLAKLDKAGRIAKKERKRLEKR